MLKKQYRNLPRPNVTTKEDVLCQRIVATNLKTDCVSARSCPAAEPRAGRVYPPEILEWSGFSDLVDNYHIRDELPEEVADDLSSIFLYSLDRATTKKSNESGEQGKLIDNLDSTLVRSGIVHDILETLVGGIVKGRIDFCLMKDDTSISIICESKSTQNLLLPIEAKLCVEKYNAAFNEMMTNEGSQTTEWSRIGHPLGQLICYMVDNAHRYGALTSGTRTYFICALNDEKSSQIMITDAWCVGEQNYLRAWAYVHSLGCNIKSTWDPPKKWFKSTNKRNTPNRWNKLYKTKVGGSVEDNKELFDANHRHVDPNDGAGTSIIEDHFYHILQRIDLPIVSMDDIEIIDVIGSGRNGCCFRVNWNGQELAMKQFDIGRDGYDYYTKEILAYMLLRDVWGILVPRPIFLSESISGGILFLGLQLGRKPIDKDDISKFQDVLYRLQKEYHIQHNDSFDGRNMIVIRDTNGNERIVAIDFEDWDFVK
jgi:hypothetical protein